MKLQQLEYFLATCQYRSFSAAADALYLAQPSLAEQVRRLEEELGVKLFVRSWRRLELTEAGRALLPHAEKVISSVEAARASVLDTRDLRGGVLSFGTFGLAHHYFVRETVSEFARRYPGVMIRVVGQNSVQVCDQIRDGELEAGLVMTPLDERGLEVEAVMREETVLVTAEPPADLPAIPIERLVGFRLILYDAEFGWNDPLRRRLAERARDHGLRLEPAIEVESYDAALKLAAQGVGSTVALRSTTESASFPNALKTISLDPPLLDNLAFVSRTGVELSPATAAFVSLTRRQIARARGPIGAAAA